MTRRAMAVTGVAAVGLFIVAILIGRHFVSGGIVDQTVKHAKVPAASTPAPAAAASDPLAGFATYRDRQTGLTIRYPGTWSSLKPLPSGVDLLAAQGNASLLVRVSPVGLDPVTTKTLPTVRPLLDSMVSADQRVTMLGTPQAVEVGGLLGYRYRYTFARPGKKSRGAHVHYFLIKQGQIIQLTFQALPSAQLHSLEPTFDVIAGTFQGKA